MGESFGYFLLILEINVPNGINQRAYFGPFNDADDAEEWAEQFGLPIGMFTKIKMIYPEALYPEPIT